MWHGTKTALMIQGIGREMTLKIGYGLGWPKERIYYCGFWGRPYHWGIKEDPISEDPKENPVNCCFLYAGNLELVELIVAKKFRRDHFRLRFLARNRIWQLVVWHRLSILMHFQNYNETALLFFVML